MRNANLAACDGTSSTACDAERQSVRNAAAEYIRANPAGLPDWSDTYANEKQETLQLANGTVTGKAAGAVEGLISSVADGAIALGKLVMNVSGSAFGNEQSQRDLREGAGAAYDFIKEPDNWPQLLGAMSPADREKLAQAYEAGDGKTIGQLMGAQLANLPIGGSNVLGSIRKVDAVVDVTADAAKIGSKAPSSPVDIAHTIGADYNARKGTVTGGHSTVNGDVKVMEIVNPPDATGVYQAKVQMRTPDGAWIDKINFRGEVQANTMFPQRWDAAKIEAEIASAWTNQTPHPDDPRKWIGTSDSGVTIEGYKEPRTTAYPVYQGTK
jgi:hypothetical protein